MVRIKVRYSKIYSVNTLSVTSMLAPLNLKLSDTTGRM